VSCRFPREWIEREDFMEVPTKILVFRTARKVRLRFGFVVKCTASIRTPRQCHGGALHYYPDSKSGTPGSGQLQGQGHIHWVAAATGVSGRSALYDRLFSHPVPGNGRSTKPPAQPRPPCRAGRRGRQGARREPKTDHNWLDESSHSKETITTYLEPALRMRCRKGASNIERHGYFRCRSGRLEAWQTVFNRTVTLRDSVGKDAK